MTFEYLNPKVREFSDTINLYFESMLREELYFSIVKSSKFPSYSQF